MLRRLIVNADDFGFSEGINRGILRAHREGILTSATLAVNMPLAEVAARASQTCPELGIGIHLNVVRGRPLLAASQIPWLVGEDGRFRRRFSSFFTLQLSMDHCLLRQIEAEYRAQIEQALAWGIHPTHLDSEGHHACWPALFRIMVTLAREYGIGAVRVPREPYWSGAPKRHWRKMVASVALRVLTLPFSAILRPHGISGPRYFYGGAHIGEVSSDYIQRLVAALPEGTHELMVHPGELDSTSGEAEKSYLDAGRMGELTALLDLSSRRALAEAKIELVSFAAVKEF